MTREWPESRQLRPWQARAFRQYAKHAGRDFMLVACPGAGKTTASLRMAHEQLANGRARRLVVVCPTEHLKVQWASAASQVGINLEPYHQNGTPLARDYDGAVVTYAQVASNPMWARMLCQVPTVAIFDEIHHAGDEDSWGEALKVGFEGAAGRLLLSGTPFRSNGQIPFVSYSDGVLDVHFEYGYGNALADDVCRPIYFPTYEGKMEWYNCGRRYTSTFQDRLNDSDASRRLRTALQADGDWIREVILDADKRLDTIRLSHPNAAGLVVAMNTSHAEAIAKRFRDLVGRMPVVVHSDNPGSSERIEAFSRSSERWIVAVKMVSEGVDIPRLRIGIYATNVTTELFFRQFAGRFVRMIPGLDDQSAYLLIPRDEVFVDIVRDIQKTRLDVLKQQAEEASRPGSAGDEPDHQDDRVTSPFVPISSTGEAHDVFHPDGVAVTQRDVQEAQQFAARAAVPPCYDPAILARFLRVSRGDDYRPESPAEHAAEEKPLHKQKKELAKVIRRHARQIVEMTDGQYAYDAVYGELKKMDGLSQPECNIDQLKLRLDHLVAWQKRLSNG